MSVIASPFPSLCNMVQIPAGNFLMGSIIGHMYAGDDPLVRDVYVSEYLIGQTATSVYQFKAYRDVLVAAQLPFSVFGRHDRTGLMEMVTRHECEKDGLDQIQDLKRDGSPYKNLEVHRVIPEKGGWKLETDDESKTRFGGDDQPVVFVDWWMALSCADWMVQEMVKAGMLAQGMRWKGRLPTEAEWEKAARGPRVDLVQVMKEEGVRPNQFAEWAWWRYENFVVNEKEVSAAEVRQRLMNQNNFLQRLLGRVPDPMGLSGYRVYSTPSGRLSDQEIWWNQDGETGRTQDVNWGPETGYGTKQMSGNVWEFLADLAGDYDPKQSMNPTGPIEGRARRMRGGSWRFQHAYPLLAASTGSCSSPDDCRSDYYIGFRVAAASSFL